MEAEDVFSGTPTLEMREYMNDVGHRIFITFINGEPQMAIPDGYFPVDDPQAQKPIKEEETQPEPSGGDDGGGGGGSSQPKPEPYSYKELSMDELQEEVTNVIKPSITIIDKIGKSIHSKLLIKEIDRRLAGDIPIYEREYLENLKTNAQNPEPSLLQKGLAKLTGQELKNNNPNLTGPTYDELPNQYGVTEAYTPEVNKADDAGGVTRPEITTIELLPADLMEQIQQASREAAEIAFGSEENKKEAAKENYTPSKITKDEQRRKDRQSANKNMAGASTSRKTGLAQSATRGCLVKKLVVLDLILGGISGLEKGGLASKKGKKKKSK